MFRNMLTSNRRRWVVALGVQRLDFGRHVGLRETPGEQLSEFGLGLKSWLATFVLSSDCYPHNIFRKNGGYTVEWFRRLSGVPASTPKYEFTRDLKAALKRLKDLSIIKQFRIKRTGDVYIWKKASR